MKLQLVEQWGTLSGFFLTEQKFFGVMCIDPLGYSNQFWRITQVAVCAA